MPVRVHSSVTRATDFCAECDFSFELELTKGRTVGEACNELGVRGSQANGDTISLGYAARHEMAGSLRSR